MKVFTSGSIWYMTNLVIDALSSEHTFPLSLPAIITFRLSGISLSPMLRIVGIDRASEVTSGVDLLISSRNKIGVSSVLASA